jgi:hypothetical protein
MSTKTFGSDPELLLTKNGKPQSAIGVIQGTPDNRITIKGHQFYYDNVLAECAIKPGKSKKEVVENFRECFQIYAAMAKPYKLTPQASEIFPDSQLKHEDARKAGCAPDWCAYRQKLMDPPKEAIQSGNLRSCGGHVHLGSETLVSDGPEPIFAIFMCDLFLGVPSLFLDRDPTSARRRGIYGLAGRYRSKDYGVEYRSLSNFWLATPKLTGLIYDLAMFAHDVVEKGKIWEMWSFDIDEFFGDEPANAYKCLAYDPKAIQDGINTGDKKLVQPHWELVKKTLPAGLLADLEAALNRGPDDDFYKSWQLT